jgi:hypothetical protein
MKSPVFIFLVSSNLIQTQTFRCCKLVYRQTLIIIPDE